MNDLIADYLQQGNVMQLATTSNNKPWICTVYYVVDADLNIYWLSFPERRHSQELKHSPRAAIAVPIKFDKPVIGVQAEGDVSVVEDLEIVKVVMDQYIAKYESGYNFYDNLVTGTNQHVMYKLKPDNFVLFDEVNFPEQGRQELAW